MPILKRILRYPIKSCMGEPLESAKVTEKGINRDRNWALFDEVGQVVTGRTHPILLDIQTSIDDGIMSIRVHDQNVLNFEIDVKNDSSIDAHVFSYEVKGYSISKDVDEWFSEYLNKKVRMLYTSDLRRPVLAKHGGRQGDILSFADQAPLLMISEASLQDLNDRLIDPIEMNRFRPNLVISDCSAFEEDTWKFIKIESCEFEVIQKCERCVFTTIDPISKQKHPQSEPLRTLSTYRKSEKGGVDFGVHLVPRKVGKVSINDSIQVIS